jgi:hypothetical protein
VQELLGKGYLNMVRGTIDYKAGQLIHYSVSRIIAQAFDEHDILVLLILLREHALANSPVRELGDFVAHRIRNRGPFLQFLRNLSPEFEKPSIPKGQGATDTLLTSIQFDKILSTPAIYSQSDILSSLNDILLQVSRPCRTTSRAILSSASCHSCRTPASWMNTKQKWANSFSY